MLEAAGGEGAFYSGMKDIVHRYGYANKYGVALLHRHFSIDDNHRLVEHGLTSTAWNTVGDRALHVFKYGGQIVPRTRRFLDGVKVPYEFAFHEGYIGDTHDNSDFDEEVHAFFQRHKLENVLGIRDIENRDHKYNIEVTEGKTNIMLAKGSLDKENTVTAL